MYQFLNIFFFVFHTSFTVFNLIGWIWPKIRKIHFLTMFATGFSWSILGIWYGFGYCPSTDWHWQVRYHLGYHDMPGSYIKFLLDSITGLNLPADLVNFAAVGIFIGVFILTTILNTRDLLRKRISSA